MEKFKIFSPKELLICLFLAVVVAFIYGQAINYDFVECDDNIYVTQNSRIKEGLTASNINWAFKSTDTGNWHPLTWLSLLVDSSLYGMHAGGYHITSIVLHLFNSIFLFLILKKITDDVFPSAMAAALFACHPLNVESVAWISERKNVLCTFFFFAALWSYFNYTLSLRLRNYISVVFLIAAGLMSKAMLVTMPAVLLLLDYWPLKRFSNLNGKKELSNLTTASNPFSKKTMVKLVLEKIPLIVLSLISAALTLYAANAGGAIRSLSEFPMGGRIANAMVSAAEYLYKMVWPFDLAFFYPWRKDVSIFPLVLSAFIILVMSAFSLFNIKKRPYILFGWFWYLITLVPVIGIVQVGHQAMADRYAYLPLIGIFIIIAWGGKDLFSRYASHNILKFSVAVSIIAFLSVVSFNQVLYWQNSETLFLRALAVTRDNHMAHQGIGHLYLLRGDNEQAEAHFREALRIRPSYADARLNLAIVNMKRGYFEEAVYNLQSIFENDKKNVKVLNNLGVALALVGRYEEARAHLEGAIRLDPYYLEAKENLEKVRQVMTQEMEKRQ